MQLRPVLLILIEIELMIIGKRQMAEDETGRQMEEEDETDDETGHLLFRRHGIFNLSNH